jgi:hypothetical protein
VLPAVAQSTFRSLPGDFEFVQSLQANSIFQKWDNISDEESQALKAEFAQEDIDFSENILADYLAHLKESEKD